MKTETIRLRLNSEIMERVRAIADKETRTLAKQVEHLLKMGLEPSKLDYYYTDIVDFLGSVENGELDQFNTMSKATKLLKSIKEDK